MAAPASRTTRSGLCNISIVRGPPRFTPYTMRRQRHPFELALTRVRYKQHTSNTKQLPRATSSGSKLFSDPEHAVCCTTCWSRARKTYKPNNQHVNGMSKCYRPRSYQASRSYKQKTKYTPRHRYSRTSCTQQLRKRLLLRNVVRLNATNRKVYLFLISTATHSTYLATTNVLITTRLHYLRIHHHRHTPSLMSARHLTKHCRAAHVYRPRYLAKIWRNGEWIRLKTR